MSGILQHLIGMFLQNLQAASPGSDGTACLPGRNGSRGYSRAGFPVPPDPGSPLINGTRGFSGYEGIGHVRNHLLCESVAGAWGLLGVKDAMVPSSL